MGCAPTSEVEVEQREVSKQIDRELNEVKKSINKELKILLLGTGACGKSTVAKQLKHLHADSFTEKDKMKFKDFMLLNIYNSMKTLVRGADDMNVEIDPEFSVLFFFAFI